MTHLDRRGFLIGATTVLGGAVASQVASARPARPGNWSDEKLAALIRTFLAAHRPEERD